MVERSSRITRQQTYLTPRLRARSISRTRSSPGGIEVRQAIFLPKNLVSHVSCLIKQGFPQYIDRPCLDLLIHSPKVLAHDAEDQ